jgi:uncharacterized protein YwbE
MELTERVPMRTIMWLSQITYSVFHADCIQSSINEGLDKPPTEDAITHWYGVLQQFCKTNIKTKGVTKRIYSFSTTTPTGMGGRLFSGGSLQGIWKKFRGLLMRDISTDLDEKNSHPTVLLYICKKHGISCPNLEYYVNNRDFCLSKFKTPEFGKLCYLKSTNNDKQNRTPGLPSEFRKYDAEMKIIQKQLIDLPEYIELVDTIPSTKNIQL